MSVTATIVTPRHRPVSRRKAAGRKAIQLTGRDVGILEAMQRYRVLHRGQISALFFAGIDYEGGSARRRLHRLYQHGYVERILRYPQSPMMNPGPAYRLARHGAEVLAEVAGVAPAEFVYYGKSDDRRRQPTHLSHSHLEHMLLLADVRIAFERGCAPLGCRIVRWLDDLDLRSSWKTERVPITMNDRSEVVPIAPDGYCVLTTAQGQGHCFIEVDRGTETIGRGWQRKILAYKAYLHSGQFHDRYRVDPRVGFRVLTLAPSAQRVQHLHTAAATYGSPEAARLFLATETPRFLTSPLNASIWRRGGVTEAQALF